MAARRADRSRDCARARRRRPQPLYRPRAEAVATWTAMPGGRRGQESACASSRGTRG